MTCAAGIPPAPPDPLLSLPLPVLGSGNTGGGTEAGSSEEDEDDIPRNKKDERDKSDQPDKLDFGQGIGSLITLRLRETLPAVFRRRPVDTALRGTREIRSILSKCFLPVSPPIEVKKYKKTLN